MLIWVPRSGEVGFPSHEKATGAGARSFDSSISVLIGKFQILKVPPGRVIASLSPSGENATRHGCRVSSKRIKHLCFSTSQIANSQTLLLTSHASDASCWPIIRNAIETTLMLTSSAPKQEPFCKSQNLTVLSLEPEAIIFQSGEIATDTTSARWFSSICLLELQYLTVEDLIDIHFGSS